MALEEAELLKALQSEGFQINSRTLRRVRADLRLFSAYRWPHKTAKTARRGFKWHLEGDSSWNHRRIWERDPSLSYEESWLYYSKSFHRNNLRALHLAVIPDAVQSCLHDLQRNKKPILHEDQMSSGLWMDIWSFSHRSMLPLMHIPAILFGYILAFQLVQKQVLPANILMLWKPRKCSQENYGQITVQRLG